MSKEAKATRKIFSEPIKSGFVDELKSGDFLHSTSRWPSECGLVVKTRDNKYTTSIKLSTGRRHYFDKHQRVEAVFTKLK